MFPEPFMQPANERRTGDAKVFSILDKDSKPRHGVVVYGKQTKINENLLRFLSPIPCCYPWMIIYRFAIYAARAYLDLRNAKCAGWGAGKLTSKCQSAKRMENLQQSSMTPFRKNNKYYKTVSQLKNMK